MRILRVFVTMMFFAVVFVATTFAGTVGPSIQDIQSTNDSVASPTALNLTITVTTGDTVYTRSFDLEAVKYMAVSYKQTTVSGTPSTKIQLEQSYDLPATEGGASTAWTIPVNMSDIETTLTNTTVNHKAVSPVALPYARFKITGGAAGSVTLRMRSSLERDR